MSTLLDYSVMPGLLLVLNHCFREMVLESNVQRYKIIRSSNGKNKIKVVFLEAYGQQILVVAKCVFCYWALQVESSVHYQWNIFVISPLSGMFIFLIAQPYGWRLLHMDILCVRVCENDNFKTCDWLTRLPEFKTGSAVQTGIQQSV